MIVLTEMSTLGFVFTIIGVLIAGFILGFIVARTVLKKQLEKNPPINEKMIRAMFLSMGRKPSEAQIRQVMNSVQRNK